MKNDDARNTTGRDLVYLAAERTLMAWVRTSLAMIALGFVIDRSGLLLRQALPRGSTVHPQAFSFWAGTALAIAGTLMAAVAAVRYLRMSLDHRREGRIEMRSGILMGVLFTLVVFVFGMIISLFLILATD